MLHNYLISITIPTYNRYENIKKTFDILKASSYFKKYEICVSDNASTDYTFNYLKDIKNKFSNVVINRNNENYGYEQNLQKAINISTGKFIWSLSDDDTVTDKALERIYKIVENNQFLNLFFLNYNIINEDTKKIINSRCEIEKNGIYNKNQFIERVCLANSFGSSNIFSREILRKHDLTKYNNNLYCHVFWGFIALKEDQVFVISKIMINMRGLSFDSSRFEKKTDPLSGFDFYLNAHFQLCKSIPIIKNNYNNVCYKKIYNQLIYDSLWQVTIYKIRNLDSNLKTKLHIFNELRFYFSKSLFFWIAICPLIFLNNNITKIIYIIQRKIRKK